MSMDRQRKKEWAYGGHCEGNHHTKSEKTSQCKSLQCFENAWQWIGVKSTVIEQIFTEKT